MATAHNIENYEVGKGILYFDKLDADGLPTGLRDLGNAPNFTLSLEVEKLSHYTSRGGIKKKDKTITLQAGAKATFTLDEYDINNLALALLGSVAGHILTILAETQIEGHLKFVGNPAEGPRFTINLWKVLISPTSEVPMISDEWAQINFEVEVQDDTANHPSSPYGTLEETFES